MVLLLVLGLSLVTPLLASGAADASVPACCRRSGRHHCTMHTGVEVGGQGPVLQTNDGSCPYCPRFAPAVHLHVFTVAFMGTDATPLASHPAGLVQTECRWRIARDRSRQKRGPPTLL